MHLLTQKPLDGRKEFYRFIHGGVGPRDVAAEGDQRFDFHIGGVMLFKQSCGALMDGGNNLRHTAADGLADINGRIVPRFRQFSRQHDMPVEHRAGAVNDGILLIIPFRQHGVDRRHRAFTVAVARALYQTGNNAKGRRRIAFGGGGLAEREGNFPLRHGVTGERIHQQQHVIPWSRKNAAMA